MSEAIASLLARQRTAELACSALPGSPVRPDREMGRSRDGGHALLRAIGMVLRGIAERLDPATPRPAATGSACN